MQDIPSSFQWQQRQQTLQEDDLDGLHLLRCQGNWTQAEQNPALLRQLLQKEVDNGWVVPFQGNASEKGVARRGGASKERAKLGMLELLRGTMARV